MNIRFNNDVTEAEIRRHMENIFEENEQLLGFGCYSGINVKENIKKILGIIFCPLSLPITMILSIAALSDLIYEIRSLKILSVSDFIFSIVLLFFVLSPLIMIYATVMCIKALKNSRYTMRYAYTSKLIVIKVDDNTAEGVFLPEVRYVKVKQYKKNSRVFVMFPLFLALTPVMYVEDGEKFCESLSADPELKIYLNNQLYSGPEI